MGYFPNGSSFAYWQDEQCSDCVNYRDNGTGSYGCAITDAHVLTKTHDKRGRRLPAFKALDFFIPDDGPDAFKCRMRLTKEMIAEAVRADQHQQDMERYLAALNETRAAQGIEARQGGDGTAPREARKPDPKGCAHE